MDFSYTVAVIMTGLIIPFSLFCWNAISTVKYWEKRGVKVLRFKSLKDTMNAVIMRKSCEEILKDMYNCFEGRFCGFFQYFTPVLCVKDPEIIQHILVKDFLYFEDRTPSTSLTSNRHDYLRLSLGNLSTDEWREARHKLTPTFTSGKLKTMAHTIKLKSEEVVLYLKKKADWEFDIKDLTLKYVLNVIGDVAFGLKVDALNEKENNEFLLASSKFFQPSYKQIIKIGLILFLPKLSHFLGFKQLANDVHDFFFNLTIDSIKYREKTRTRKNDFLQLMLDQKNKEQEYKNKLGTLFRKENGNELEMKTSEKDEMSSVSDIFTNEFMASQTFGFISAGSEATSGALSNILFELAMHQNHQHRVQQEIDNIINKYGVNYDSLKKLTYMDQVINETLRLHPSFIGLSRICTKKYTIPGTNSVLEKGTFVLIPVCGLHNDPQYFPDPGKFNPDRFEDMNTVPKGVFFPFGSGPRMCIAIQLAILEMKMFLAVILSFYSVHLGSKTQLPLSILKNSIATTIKGGLWLRFEKREEN